MKLAEIIEGLDRLEITGDTGRRVKGITFDSRHVQPGDLFVAVRGTGADGHDYIPEALDRGAIAVVSEEAPVQGFAAVTWIRVEHSRTALALMASAWYGHPSRDLYLVGVTGTNGKTTIATLLHRIHTGLGFRAGLLSTIQVMVGEESFPATHTTPDPLTIQRYLRRMVDAGCGYCFMEVSSHAIDQDRIGGLEFKGAVFTNLTRDHLDYHDDFKEYLRVKKRLFDQLPSDAWALVNADDKNGRVMLQNCRARQYAYSLRSVCDFRGRLNEMHMEGSFMEIEGKELWVKLPGRFNASNLLCTYAATVLSGQEPEAVLRELSQLEPVRGRFETCRGKSGSTGIVDYAHTPDALGKVLETITEVNRAGSQLVTVIGAGGDRDRGKRPQMALIASEASDKVILTSDNPRNEDPERILDDMLDGVPAGLKDRVLRISDREEAIRTACMLAGPGDIILVAGKGHERYQVVGTMKVAFDDMQILQKHIK